MSSPVAREELIAKGLRRTAFREARSATSLLRGDQPLSVKNIHAVRKSIKRLNALMLLIEGDDEKDTAHRGKRLRRAKRSLSPLRDLDILKPTLTSLLAGSPRLIGATARREIGRRLGRDRRLLHRASLDDRVPEHIAGRLHDASEWIAAWQPHHQGFDICTRALTDSHERCRRALRRAGQQGGHEAFHELRKRLTTLRNQLMLVVPAHSQRYGDVLMLDAAVSSLGRDHNLVVLVAALARMAREGGVTLDLARLNRAVSRRQRDLRAQALAGAAPICLRRTREYVDSLQAGLKQPRARVVPRRPAR